MWDFGCYSGLFCYVKPIPFVFDGFSYVKLIVASAMLDLLPQLVAAALCWVLVCLCHETLVVSVMGPMSLATLLPKNSLLQVCLGNVEPDYYGGPEIENRRL